MGNSSSRSEERDVFKKELEIINDIVNNIINEDNIFKNKDYNFLSQDVCNNYQVVLEDELEKHLKLSINSLGTSLYIIPKDDDTKLTKLKLTKKEVCEKISNHYIKILYMMSLVKYVYSLETNGDLSIAGIVMRNIRILDDIMEINFCDLPHKNYSVDGLDSYRIDFSKLEGFKFFVEFVLSPNEAQSFLGVVKAILGRSSKNKVATAVCASSFSPTGMKELEDIYNKKYGEKLICRQSGGGTAVKKLAMNIFVNKDNPIFTKDLCFAPRKVVIKTSTKPGQEILNLYKIMKQNYVKNVKSMEEILKKLVHKYDGIYLLNDINKGALDSIITEIKNKVKILYIQSIVDYQNLLDKAKLIPNIEFSN